MAQKRMLDKKISISEQVANLTVEAQLLFTWMIPHADDMGMLPYSSRQIKALVVPMNEKYTAESIGIHLEDIRKQDLINIFECNNEKFWFLKSFHSQQTQKKDRDPQTLLKYDKSKYPSDNWNRLETIVFRKEGNELKEGKEGVEGKGYKNFQDAKKQIGKIK